MKLKKLIKNQAFLSFVETTLLAPVQQEAEVRYYFAYNKDGVSHRTRGFVSTSEFLCVIQYRALKIRDLSASVLMYIYSKPEGLIIKL